VAKFENPKNLVDISLTEDYFITSGIEKTADND
jgi:hypothetical protein